MKNGFGLIGIIIVTAVIASFAIGGGMYWNETKKQQSLFETGADAIKRTEELKKQIESREEQIYGGSTSIDLTVNISNWEIYRNDKLGITFRYPLRDYYGELKLIEDQNIVYLVSGGDKYDNQKREEAQKSGKSDIEKVSGIPWAILVRNIASEAELDGFIRERYGKGCNVGKKIPSKIQEGVFDIKIGWDTPDPELVGGVDCFINYITVIKYHPSLKKVVTWDIGQDVNFVGPAGSSLVFDESIRDSFRFLDESTDISTWKTYRNEKYGFEVKYPEQWKLSEFEKKVSFIFQTAQIDIEINPRAVGLQDEDREYIEESTIENNDLSIRKSILRSKGNKVYWIEEVIIGTKNTYFIATDFADSISQLKSSYNPILSSFKELK